MLTHHETNHLTSKGNKCRNSWVPNSPLPALCPVRAAEGSSLRRVCGMGSPGRGLLLCVSAKRAAPEWLAGSWALSRGRSDTTETGPGTTRPGLPLQSLMGDPPQHTQGRARCSCCSHNLTSCHRPQMTTGPCPHSQGQWRSLGSLSCWPPHPITCHPRVDDANTWPSLSLPRETSTPDLRLTTAGKKKGQLRQALRRWEAHSPGLTPGLGPSSIRDSCFLLERVLGGCR